MKSGIKTLILDYNDIGSDGLNAMIKLIKGSPRLEALSLSGNQLVGQGSNITGGLVFAEFTRALATNTSLQTLKLNKTGLGPDEGRALADALRVNTTLKQIHVVGNKFDDTTRSLLTNIRPGLSVVLDEPKARDSASLFQKA